MPPSFRSRIPLCMAAFVLAAAVCFAGTAPVIGLHENTPNVAALTNARIIVAPGDTIETGTIVIRGRWIEAVGEHAAVPPDAVVKDMKGRTVYPGFIDLYTHYGIPSKAEGSQDAAARHWNTSVLAERRAADMFAPDDKAAEAMRKYGFTAVMSCPRDGIFRGTGALVLLAGEDVQRAVLAEDVAQFLSFRRSGGNYPRSLMGSMALMRQTFLDAGWYVRAHEVYGRSPAGQKPPETNLSLAALAGSLAEHKPFIIETGEYLDILRAADIAKEFGLGLWVRGSGYEYRRPEAVTETGARVILPLAFPDPPDVSTDETSLRNLRHWDTAPENPKRLAEAGIIFALSADGLDNDDDFLKNLRTAIKRGLDKDAALTALTVTPASWLEMPSVLGTVERGKLANLVVTDGDIFADETKVLETWVAGMRHEVTPVPDVDIRGNWSLDVSPGDRIGSLELKVTGKPDKPAVKVLYGDKKIDALGPELEKRLIMLAFPTDSLGFDGTARLNGIVEENRMHGRGEWGDGARFDWLARLTKPFEAEPDTTEAEPPETAEFPVVYPDGAYGREFAPIQPETVLVKNAVIWTSSSDGILDGADMLVKRGRIEKIGGNIGAPRGALVIDAAGKHVTPGLIDAHSHLAVSRGINESSHSITSETRIADVINCDDINIYRQMAGGLTASCLLHGSANSIGGQNAVVKLRWGATPAGMIVEDAHPTIKFALGENVKRSNVTGPPTTRYPRTRMGVEQFMRDSFQAAKDYRQRWNEYERAEKKNINLVPPRRDLRLDPLVEVLEGRRWIHCHSYRQDEIQAMIRVADEMGFKVKVFIHNLEGYKVAEIMKEHGSMPTVFSDWWVYKFEVYDAIPYNGALLWSQGLLVSYNSDDTELARRMNLEAAKAVKYGGVPPEEALKFVTINPAIQLGVDHSMGSLEKGKDADFVVWSGSPLSTYSVCEQTWIDGRRYFDIAESRELSDKAERERAALVQKVLKANGGKKK